MHIITLLGSPRVNGNTAHVLAWVEQSLREAGHTAERITLIKHAIGPCRECLACRKESGTCANHADDANEILSRMWHADALVLAAPLFCWGFPSHTKALLDRTYALVDDCDTNPEYLTKLSHKPIGLLLTCAGPNEGNAEWTIRGFEAFVEFMKASPRPHLIYPFFRTPQELGERDRKRAEDFASALVAGD